MEELTQHVSVRMNRKTVLDPLSKSLGVNAKKFKNKKLLVEEIRRVQSLERTQRCYNTHDPCTMEPLNEIDDKFYIEWNQYNHRFGADARSIQQMINTKNNMLPWSIDFSTGIQASLDHETYKQAFDMTLVPGLLDRLNALESNEPDQEDTNDKPTSFTSTCLFEIDQILGSGGSYAYGVVLNKIINNPNVRNIYKLVSENMYKLLFQLQWDPSMRLYFDVFYQYCYVYYTSQAFHIRDREAHLLFLVYTLKQFHSVLGEPASVVLQMLFMDM